VHVLVVEKEPDKRYSLMKILGCWLALLAIELPFVNDVRTGWFFGYFSYD
jgi:hypothetical protein